MIPRIKICGLTTAEAIEAANDADYLGFIFFPQSPRNLAPKQAARLAAMAQKPFVAVTVAPDDLLLESIFSTLKPDYLQLHGSESPARVKAIKAKYDVPIIKAFSVRNSDDIAAAHEFEEVSDILLFDAKAPKGGLPGGNGLSFDWRLLSGRQFQKPWFLSGGINADNVEEAMRISGARMVDVSSSLESAPGMKDPALVRAFIQKVKSLNL
jgi:phosphoribosylanthranilate isomerase